MLSRLFKRSGHAMLCPGALLSGRYFITDSIARTHFSEVYEARDKITRNVVVVKVLREEKMRRAAVSPEESRAQFKREAEMLASLRHDKIVRSMASYHPSGGRAFIVMEHIPGSDLEAALERFSYIPFSLAKLIMIQLCDALAAVHAAGITHRDVRPRNILLIAATGLVKLIDFGIATRCSALPAEPAREYTQIYAGTPEYISPEQIIQAPTDHRVDIYAAGTTMYRMLCGRVPFVDTDLRTLLLMHQLATPPMPTELNPHIPKPAVPVIMRALEKNPSNRFQSAVEMRDAIASIA